MKQPLPQIFQVKLLTAALLAIGSSAAYCAPLTLTNTPLFVTGNAKANILLIYSNSNAMDEDPTGLAVGSNSPSSKSEIARVAARSLVTSYTGKINMGLMAYQQSGVVHQWLNQSPYDVSFDPAHYNPSWTGARDSATNKKFKLPNSSSPNAAGACTTVGGVQVDCVYYNVNLPFYTSGPQGNVFCYSSTVGTSTPTFPGDHTNGYACYQNKTGTSNAAPGAAGAGYSSFLFSSGFFPTESDFAQNIDDFGQRVTSSDAGPAWFANSSPGLGYLHVPIANLDTTQAGKLNTKLATSIVPTYNAGTWNDNPTGIPGGNTPTNPNAPLINAGLSPITGTFMTAKDYFNGATSSFSTAQGGAQAAPADACGKDFTVFLTNGLPSRTSTGAAVTYGAGQPFSAPEVSNAITAVTNLNSGTRPVKTYVIGFALPEFTNNYFVTNPPNPLDQMASAGGTSTAYFANNLTTLNSAFSTIFNNILAVSGAAASVTLSSASVAPNGKIYQSQFNATDWSGDLVALNQDPSTGLPTTIAWRAATQLNTQNFNTGRSIITIKPSSGVGIPFRWPANASSPTATELDITQTDYLNKTPTGVTDTNGANRLNYVRGDTTQTSFRTRPITVLGDLVDSAPYFVGPPDNNYSDYLESSPYSSFMISNASRTPMIYVGANDGMLHGFDADTGVEKLAYVPSPVYSNLTQLTSTTYSHRYFVNGSPTVQDAFYGGAWHTILVSGLAGGGQGFFALDVTNPGNFSEANASSLVRWEFTDSNDGDLGYSFSEPTIAKMNDGTWVAIFGNGYNNTAADSNVSTTGRAVLYIVNLQTGALIKRIDTKYGTTTTPNGLATPKAVDLDGDGTVDVAYAGDLAGNLWKFDLRNSNPAQWDSAFVSGSTPQPLFVAMDSSGNRQPITSTPDIVAHPSGTSYGYLVMFGTGKYLETTDPSTTSTQTFYGIQDKGILVSGRSSLVQQTITSTTTVATGKTYRVLSGNPVDWAGGTVRGWYLDLPTNKERVINGSITDSNRVIFTSIIPTTAVCTPGGTGQLMVLDVLTGGKLSSPTFDVNGTGAIDSNDYVGTPGVYPGGVALDAIPSAARIQRKSANSGGGSTGGGSSGGGILMIPLSSSNNPLAPPLSSTGSGSGSGNGNQNGNQNGNTNAIPLIESARTTWREIIQ